MKSERFSRRLRAQSANLSNAQTGERVPLFFDEARACTQQEGEWNMSHTKSSIALMVVVVLSLAFGIQAQEAETRNLFVADRTTGFIVVFSPSGENLGIFASGLITPTGLAFDKRGNLYVSEINGNTIHRFSPSGEDLGYFAASGLNVPRGLAFDRHGTL